MYMYVKADRLNVAFKISTDNLLFTNTSWHMSPHLHCHKDTQYVHAHVALWFMIRNDPCSSSLQPLPHSLPLNMLHPSAFQGCKFPPLSIMKSTNGMKLEGELEKCFPRHQLRLAVTFPRAFTHCDGCYDRNARWLGTQAGKYSGKQEIKAGWTFLTGRRARHGNPIWNESVGSQERISPPPPTPPASRKQDKQKKGE